MSESLRICQRFDLRAAIEWSGLAQRARGRKEEWNQRYNRNHIRYGEDIARRTRNYAKRQIAWFRNQPEVRWFDPHRQDEILRNAEKFLKSGK